MADMKSTGRTGSTSRNSTASKSSIASKSRTASKRDDNVALRAARTVRDRPYASAAIATGAVTAVAAAAAGAFFFSRREKSFKEASDELSTRVKEGFADVSERVSGLFTSDKTGSDGLSQSEIAEEALTLKETGDKRSSFDATAKGGIKAGAVAY